MSVITKTEAGSYRLRWRDEEGVQHQKTFATRQQARKYEEMLTLAPEEKGARITVADFMIKYRDEVSSYKGGARSEILRINSFLRRDFTKLPLSKVTTAHIDKYFKQRKEEGSSRTGGEISDGTILRESITLSAIFSHAKRLGLIKENPVSKAKKPKEPEHRERIASDEDIEKLLVVSGWDGESVPYTLIQLTMAAFLFSCRTGMRSGEILKMEPAWIKGRVINIPASATKTRSRRQIPLGDKAYKILQLVIERDPDVLFADLTDASRDVLWRRIRDRAGLGPVVDSKGRLIEEGLNFHDGRATFCTWAASPDPRTGAPRLDILSLARTTGHHDLKMLQKYYRESAENLVSRLEE